MFLNVKDLSEYLKIKPSTLYSWAARGIIPHYKVYGLLRFKKEEIDLWIESFKGTSKNTLLSATSFLACGG